MTDVSFAYSRPRGSKVACSVCGREGYPGGRWQESCRRGHAPCLVCGRQLVVKLDGSPRVHGRCPGRVGGVLVTALGEG